MKTNVFSIVFLLIGVIVFTTSCEEAAQTSNQILYPEDGHYGKNILNHSQFDIELYNDTTKYTYSLRADLQKDAHLKVVMFDEILHAWGYATGRHNGWIISRSNDSTFIFYAYGPVVCDVYVRFDKHGSSRFEFYENGSNEPNRIKNIEY